VEVLSWVVLQVYLIYSSKSASVPKLEFEIATSDLPPRNIVEIFVDSMTSARIKPQRSEDKQF
jgi:hypothetical protein